MKTKVYRSRVRVTYQDSQPFDQAVPSEKHHQAVSSLDVIDDVKSARAGKLKKGGLVGPSREAHRELRLAVGTAALAG